MARSAIICRTRFGVGALLVACTLASCVFWFRSYYHPDAWLASRNPGTAYRPGLQLHSWHGRLLVYYDASPCTYDLRGFGDDYAWALRPHVSVIRHPELGGHTTVEIGVRYWHLTAGVAGAAAICLIPSWLHHRRRRIPPGHCQKCGYNLTGNVSGRCPECGTGVHA